MSSPFVTSSPARSTSAIKISKARLPRRTGVSPSNSTCCAGRRQKGPTKLRGAAVSRDRYLAGTISASDQRSFLPCRVTSLVDSGAPHCLCGGGGTSAHYGASRFGLGYSQNDRATISWSVERLLEGFDMSRRPLLFCRGAILLAACRAAPAFNSPCRRSQTLRRDAALVSRPKEQATRPRVLLWVKLRSPDVQLRGLLCP